VTRTRVIFFFALCCGANYSCLFYVPTAIIFVWPFKPGNILAADDSSYSIAAKKQCRQDIAPFLKLGLTKVRLVVLFLCYVMFFSLNVVECSLESIVFVLISVDMWVGYLH